MGNPSKPGHSMIRRTPPPIFWRGSLALAPPISTVWKYDHFIYSQAPIPPKKKKTSHPIPPPSQHCHTSRPHVLGHDFGKLVKGQMICLILKRSFTCHSSSFNTCGQKAKKHRWRSESYESNPGWPKKSYRGRKSNLIMYGLLMISDDDRMDRWTAEMTYPE